MLTAEIGADRPFTALQRPVDHTADNQVATFLGFLPSHRAFALIRRCGRSIDHVDLARYWAMDCAANVAIPAA